MLWGKVQLSSDMGVAASVLVEEHIRRSQRFGENSREVAALVASELGFEHHLGMLSMTTRSERMGNRRGARGSDYCLDRCLIEAAGASIEEKGKAMCAEIVGQGLVEERYQSLFGRKMKDPVPEIYLHPASTVGQEVVKVETQEELVGVSGSGIGVQVSIASADVTMADELHGIFAGAGDVVFPLGYCYLALFKQDCRLEASQYFGANPLFMRLLDEGKNRRWFLPESQLDRLWIQSDGRNYHVDTSGRGVEYLVFVNSLTVNFRLVDETVLPPYNLFRIGDEAGDLLCRWLSSVAGQQIQLGGEMLHLVSNSAALLDSEAKKNLRTLEALGDSILSTMVAYDVHVRKGSVEEYQVNRSRLTNNKVLSEKFMEFVPPGAVRFAGGVDPSSGKTGAMALESIFAAVWMKYGSQVLARVLVSMRLIDAGFRLPTML